MFSFKLKTAYEMRMSDWSSDVCSSDLIEVRHVVSPIVAVTRTERRPRGNADATSRISAEASAGRLSIVQCSVGRASHTHTSASKSNPTGRASGRERECQYV